MANRYCERSGCGIQMTPRWPRTRMPNGELWCPSCAVNHGKTFKQAAFASWTPEELVRHELGRQRVQLVQERAQGKVRPLCRFHTDDARRRAGIEGEIAYGTGLRDEGERSPLQIDPQVREGRCDACTAQQNRGMPWQTRQRPRHAPPERQEQSPMPETASPGGGWPARPRRSYERSVPVDTTIQSLNSRTAAFLRVAVRAGQGLLGDSAPDAQRLAHFLAWDRPPIVRLAHDSGDGKTIFHCPFCGSGQVIARSDGTTFCEFCRTAFTVQVQPEFSSFPQTIDGVPVDVPGMPKNSIDPAMDPNMEEGAVPPGEPMAGQELPEDEEGDEESEDLPPFMKGSSFRTHAGTPLDAKDYMRYLALRCAPDRTRALAAIRDSRR